MAASPSAEIVDLRGLNYTVHVPFNETTPVTGGNSLIENLNTHYESGDIAWMITATALVLLMIPGVGLFYSGLCRRKAALSPLWLTLVSTFVVSVQWFVVGYSLTFSHTGGWFIGDLQNVGFRNVLAAPSVSSARVPDLLFAVYQGMFAAITVAIAIGAVCERGRMLPAVVFMIAWTTLIYDPIACWTWNPAGWAEKLGGLDFAGGTPVHIASGCAALAYSYMLGSRAGNYEEELTFRPHSPPLTVLGTVFMWVGWFGFNAGSALSANLRAVMAAVNTNLAAVTGGIAWVLLDYKVSKRWSTSGCCSGIVAGLVAITPGSGFVPVWSAPIFGLCAGFGCNLATLLKNYTGIDDSLDIFAVHAIGGLIGNILTGFFAADYIAHLDGYTTIPGGWVNGNWLQLGWQLTDSLSGAFYSFFGTLIILFFINLIPGLKLRLPLIAEELGVDTYEHGEFAYDYVEYHPEASDLEGLTYYTHSQDRRQSIDSTSSFSTKDESSHSKSDIRTIDEKAVGGALDSYKAQLYVKSAASLYNASLHSTFSSFQRRASFFNGVETYLRNSRFSASRGDASTFGSQDPFVNSASSVSMPTLKIEDGTAEGQANSTKGVESMESDDERSQASSTGLAR